jgi:hypothetical protein
MLVHPDHLGGNDRLDAVTNFREGPDDVSRTNEHDPEGRIGRQGRIHAFKDDSRRQIAAHGIDRDRDEGG